MSEPTDQLSHQICQRSRTLGIASYVECKVHWLSHSTYWEESRLVSCWEDLDSETKGGQDEKRGWWDNTMLNNSTTIRKTEGYSDRGEWICDFVMISSFPFNLQPFRIKIFADFRTLHNYAPSPPFACYSHQCITGPVFRIMQTSVATVSCFVHDSVISSRSYDFFFNPGKQIFQRHHVCIPQALHNTSSSGA